MGRLAMEQLGTAVHAHRQSLVHVLQASNPEEHLRRHGTTANVLPHSHTGLWTDKVTARFAPGWRYNLDTQRSWAMGGKEAGP